MRDKKKKKKAIRRLMVEAKGQELREDLKLER